ncbi:uncharacterized protein BJ212DRAFT_1411712 [Suillus subaureus]|uniref:Uncharacterized protein n=1 Tax=Suillus subaureus TaxID=48587 RepID=A0A9P7ARH0_9AGAM|nr:uncharacterized protein BJ212DRAFT_1411712 [Suillus subaureus]KAG1794978.1 hypothetical protein BJ212DRAFT_1411712 [Suillus subaureus]
MSAFTDVRWACALSTSGCWNRVGVVDSSLDGAGCKIQRHTLIRIPTVSATFSHVCIHLHMFLPLYSVWMHSQTFLCIGVHLQMLPDIFAYLYLFLQLPACICTYLCNIYSVLGSRLTSSEPD